MPLIVPDDLFVRGCPAVLLFGDQKRGIQGIAPGAISDVVQAGAGSGVVEASGVARDAFSVVLRCKVGGEINASAVANPGLLPVFAVSRNGGATYESAVRVTDTLDEAYIKDASTGLTFTFRNGAAPSFVVGTTYSFTTQASPDILAIITEVEAEILESACGSYDPPISAYPAHWKRHAVALLRWYLLEKIGVSKDRDLKIYSPVETRKWLEDIRTGSRAVKPDRQGLAESAPGTSFPLLVPPLPDPLVPPI